MQNNAYSCFFNVINESRSHNRAVICLLIKLKRTHFPLMSMLYTALIILKQSPPHQAAKGLMNAWPEAMKCAQAPASLLASCCLCDYLVTIWKLWVSPLEHATASPRLYRKPTNYAWHGTFWLTSPTAYSDWARQKDWWLWCFDHLRKNK